MTHSKTTDGKVISEDVSESYRAHAGIQNLPSERIRTLPDASLQIDVLHHENLISTLAMEPFPQSSAVAQRA
jgi:hypothetical protein